MKKLAAALAAVALCSAAARAGVVIEEQEVTNLPDRSPVVHKRIRMIEGHKQKMLTQRSWVIIDLDKGLTTVIDLASGTYSERAFPPAGPGSRMIESLEEGNPNFQKTGGQRKVAGYNCEEYSGSGASTAGEYSMTACYSNTAPGAAEYTAFQNAMALKLKRSGAAGPISAPQGVPLEVRSTSKVTGNFSLPGMPPEQARMLGQMMAKHPIIVSATTVTRITTGPLAADTFAPPAGFAKREPSLGHGGATAGSPAGQSNRH